MQPSPLPQFEQKLQENGLDIREKFLKNASGIYAGQIANSDNEIFNAQILETENGVVYEFQSLHEDKIQQSPPISIPQLALDAVLPLFAQKIVARDILAQEIARKALAKNIAERGLKNAINQQLGNALMSEAIQETATNQQEQESRKQEFFRKKADKDFITNQKINQIFDGKVIISRQLPTRKLPTLSKINLGESGMSEQKPAADTAASQQENLKRKEESGLRDAEKRQDEQQREAAQNAQQQQQAQDAQHRKQQAAQRRQKSQKNAGISWLTGGAIGAGVTIGGTGFFTLLFS